MFGMHSGRHGRHMMGPRGAMGEAQNYGPHGGSRRFGSFEARWDSGDEGRGSRGPRGRGRMFDGGELRLVLLKLIADQPRHGYDLIREIEALTGGGYAPSPGVIYPTITLLSDMGLIEEQVAEGAKKLFAVTPAGRALLDANKAQVEALFARLAEVGAQRQKTDGAPIRRAMGNLRQVLQHRLSREDSDGDTLHQVAALLDEVAQKIERLK